ncbi:Oligoxyloglucan reducing end-specific cellobiohydrolase [Athelia psychrophila]|uniref:Vacuolar protein sorting/targeting protein 10 n=1 Tax=Athelia psychrophila TaxID=1759441 RepID=A0A167VCH5_9AGAM|nr:Oligoxyloglucan reducing end-specific cellobiohydrolase [Fibularhizoctonia sp. CBS 109695]
MAPAHRATAFLLFLWALILCIPLALAQDPEHSVSYFENLPARLFFLDDTTSVIYHDIIKGDVYVSSDEGKNWALAQGVPEGQASMVFEHPFNNRYAFVLTRGKTHYRTEDRGKTWRSFDMPVAPAYVPQPLSFHSDPAKDGYILYQGMVCSKIGWGSVCHDETWYTKDAFADSPTLLLSETSKCTFAHSSADFKHDAHVDLIYCVAFDTSSATSGSHSLASSRLFSSTDFFASENKVEDLGIGKNAKGVMAFAIVSKFAVVAMRDLAPGNNGEMMLYVSVDTKTWAKAQFPHASSARLRENAYTIVESTTHSLAVDVVLQDLGSIGTLFMSNSNGTFFVESLKDTNRNEYGFVDYENIYGVDGVGIANVVANAQDVEGRKAQKQLKSVITMDDGSTWARIMPPSTDIEGKRIPCNTADADCSLHFHSVTAPHNFGRIFSSPAPGFVMGVGSIGAYLKPYEDCDTFLSDDAGLTWKMVRTDAHQYEFGDSGSILVVVNDEEGVDEVRYSTNMGKDWKSYKFGIRMRSRLLMTLPDSTSQKFILLGQIARKDQKDGQGRYAIVFLDFANTRGRQCEEKDFERWNARASKDKTCIMGHKQWYNRRKADAECYVGGKFQDPIEHDESCPCEDSDFECDYNFVRHDNACIPVGPEPIEAGVCSNPEQTYMGSSGYRLIPGNTCDRARGLQKDEKIAKKCSQAEPAEGDVIHQTFEFPAQVVQHSYFRDSDTILVRLADHSIWQSRNEGYTWNQIEAGERFLGFYMHSYANDRAYLLTGGTKFFYTTDTGESWQPGTAPIPPNTFNAQVFNFHPNSDYLLYVGNKDCDGGGMQCHAEAFFSRDNGRRWTEVEKYVRNCAWARDSDLKVDPTQILCESFKTKAGSQNSPINNPLELVSGTNFFQGTKTKLFNEIVGFAKFSEYLLVAEFLPERQTLDLQVSLDGRTFATGQFPPSMHPDTHAYTILESSTDSVFLHMTMSEAPAPYWGNILKSNWNGTYYGLSVDFVNRDQRGFVDFEKMIGLDGIALINVVSNPAEAIISGRKALQSRITHNDGGSWKTLTPPSKDSQGNSYECTSVDCALHVHGYTERADPRATYSSPSIVGLIMAVGNVGKSLKPYTESDTFMSRDGGFTWEEVHKDAHLWEFGDSGSVLIMANDEEPTDHVLFSTNEGLTWREYKFGEEKVRVKSIVTVPSDTSRRFILMATNPRTTASIAVHLDFSALTHTQCVLDPDDLNHDDFELWSPSEERSELCLFGRQTMYHRRIRDKNCVVGKQEKVEEKIVKNCACVASDFECEFNYERTTTGQCELAFGATPLPDDDSCRNGEEYWYERTGYRKIPHSSCEDGDRPDRGHRHVCPGIGAHGFFFWLFVLFVPFAFTAMVGTWYYRRGGFARGTIRLPGESSRFDSDSGVMATLASVPWFLVGLAGIAFEWVAERVQSVTDVQSRRGYRDLPVDEDAQVLRFEDED